MNWIIFLKKCNEARWKYISELAQKLKENEDPKPFWNYVKSKRKGTNNLVSLKLGQTTITDDYSIACSMNSYFSLQYLQLKIMKISQTWIV